MTTSDSSPRDAIVILQQPPNPMLPARLRPLYNRRKAIEAKAQSQAGTLEAVTGSLTRSLGRHLDEKVRLAPIGSGALPVMRARGDAEGMAALRATEGVRAVIPNQPIKLISPRASTMSIHQAGAQWRDWQDHCGVTKAWGRSKGQGVKVAVLDTGVHAAHPGLGGCVENFVVIDPCRRLVEAKPYFDTDNHGTHVSGIIAGRGTDHFGVAPEVTLAVAVVLLGGSSVDTLVAGISWAIDQGADVICMSLGFPYYEPLFDVVFENVLAQNVVPVVAIGNEYHGNTSSPGSCPHALGVGAVGWDGRVPQVADFSSGASLTFPQQAKYVHKPDLVAPGVDILSTLPPPYDGAAPDYGAMSGTSMATPFVAGCAALALAAKPNLPAADLVQLFRDTARHPTPNVRPDNRWGHGLIDVGDAISQL